ncbi:Gamma-aminobutyric acid receptor subunit beta-like, partial [Paramuricea clavata]
MFPEDVLIIAFGEIKEATMEYVVDFYLGQFWRDHRFAFGINKNYTMGDEFVNEIWTPDTFVINAVQTRVHKLIKQNQKIFMNLTDGFTMHTSRVTSSCKLNLRNYPKDTQECSLPFESYTYEEFELIYKWRTNKTIFIFDGEMAQFTITKTERHLKHPKYHSPQFSGLTVTFTFQRRWIYYVYQVYVPCICITVLSWIGFWIDHKAVPARTGLGITTVLTMVYMLASVNNNLPRVTYLKSIDNFVLVCFGFIFLTSLEYVVAIRFSQSRRASNDRKNQNRLSDNLSEDEKPPLTIQVNQSGKLISFQEKPPPRYECNGHASLNGQNRPKLTRADSARSSSLLYSHVVKPRGQTKLPSSLRNRASPIHKIVTHDNVIDMISRVLFPVAFIIFNVIYWIDFLEK